MCLAFKWLRLSVLGSTIGGIFGLIIVGVVNGLLAAGKNPNDELMMTILVIGVLIGMLIGAITLNRYCIRLKTKVFVESIIARSYPDDYAIQKRAGRAWLHWHCGRPMLKVKSGKHKELSRICLHCGHHEEFVMLRYSAFDSDIWGWREAH